MLQCATITHKILKNTLYRQNDPRKNSTEILNFHCTINLFLNKTWPQGYKTFFVLVLRLVLRTRSLCSTEYDTENRGYKSFGVHSPLSWIWSTY